MLRQLSLHYDYVLLLVQDGYYLDALRYARKNKVIFPCALATVIRWINRLFFFFFFLFSLLNLPILENSRINMILEGVFLF